MNRKQFIFLWFGIVVIVIGGLIAVFEGDYASFYVLILITTVLVGGLIYSFRSRVNKEAAVKHERIRQESEDILLRQKKPYRYNPHIVLAIIFLVLLILACMSIIQHINLSRPKWWLDKAKNAAGDISEAYYQAETYLRIAESEANVGNITGAIAIAENISKYNLRANAYTVIVKAHEQNGDKAAALATLKHAEDTAILIDDIGEQAWYYAYLAFQRLDIGDIDGSLAIVKQELTSAIAMIEVNIFFISPLLKFNLII